MSSVIDASMEVADRRRQLDLVVKCEGRLVTGIIRADHLAKIEERLGTRSI